MSTNKVNNCITTGLIAKCLLLAAFAVTCITASADTVVFNNGGPNQQNGNAMGDFVQGESFSLGSATNLTGVRFWDLEAAGQYSGSISWYIFNDCGGTVCGGYITAGNASGTHVATGLLDASNTYSEFVNNFGIAATLSAGNYWLFLHNGPVVGNDAFTDFYWEWTSGGSGPTGQEYDLIANNGFDDNGAEHAYLLTGEVATPEPGSLALLGSGLIGLGGAARRRWLK